MSSLDEMFNDALQREATTPSDERLAAIAEVTIHRARRHRRARAAVEILATGVVVGAGFVVGAMIMGGDATTPVTTPTPPPSVPTPAPIVDVKADARMPQAPPMTDDDWSQVATSWDAELANFKNVYPVTTGSTVGIYFTPPGGERKLAYSSDAFPIENPKLLAFDPSTNTALVYAPGPATLNTLNVNGGSLAEIQWDIPQTPYDARPLGRASDGSSLFLLETVATNGEITSTIYREDGDSFVAIHAGQFDASPVWEDWIVVYENDVLNVVDAMGIESTHELTQLAGCSFDVWNGDSTFTATCPTSQDRTGNIYAVNPENGATDLIWADADLDSLTTDLSPLTAFNWIDANRRSTNIQPFGGQYYAVPPDVYGPGDEVADLSADFVNIPDQYTMIFGTRNE